MRLPTSNLAAAASFGALVALATVALVQHGLAAGTQDGSANMAPMMDHAMPGHDQMPGMMQHRQQMMGTHGGHAARMAGTTPTLPGQDAFGTIQEIVRMLDADPKTDWSKVNLEALRQHLIDMNDVTLTPTLWQSRLTVASRSLSPGTDGRLRRSNAWSQPTLTRSTRPISMAGTPAPTRCRTA
jgi:hypothetical protein